MRSLWIGLAAAALLLQGGVMAHAGELPRGGDITCKGPFTNQDTGAALLDRYKPDARILPSADITGEQFEALTLFPDDPALRLELEEFTGTGTGAINSVNIKDKESRWTIEGVKLGLTPAELVKQYGGPVMLSGFEQMSESTFGMVGWLQKGDCTVVAVFYSHDGPKFDHPLWQKEIAADDPRVAALGLKIEELILNLPSAKSE